MKPYIFVCPDLERLTIFAPDEGTAVRTYATWFDARECRYPDNYCIDVWRAPEGHSPAHLDAVLADGITDVGRYDSSTGWTILAADHLLTEEEG
ncbi:hypothetical protein [Sphingomonas sp. PB4P5]|uniref:hypothetical protein n=1 Tax=Parasphingomonas puruogangriensis TaxID=3096155 RepID=UPI002FC882EC